MSARQGPPRRTDGRDADMPSLTNLKAATDEGVKAIQAAGVAASERIEQACSQAVDRMEWARRSRADVLVGRTEFSSWQLALVVFGGFIVEPPLTVQQKSSLVGQFAH